MPGYTPKKRRYFRRACHICGTHDGVPEGQTECGECRDFSRFLHAFWARNRVRGPEAEMARRVEMYRAAVARGESLEGLFAEHREEGKVVA